MMTLTETVSVPSREALFIGLYQRVFPGVAAFVHKRGGSLDEAKDLFQDALVIYFEKKQQPGFCPEESETSYLAGICKHLWYKTYRKKQSLLSLDLPGELPATEDAPAVSPRLLNLIAQSGRKCLDLLKAFYYDRMSMKEVSEAFGFSGERSATVQKHKCLEKIRNEIQTRTLQPDDFYE